jgi:hypothetical protein
MGHDCFPWAAPGARFRVPQWPGAVVRLAVAGKQKAMSRGIESPPHGRGSIWSWCAGPCGAESYATHPTQARNGEQNRHEQSHTVLALGTSCSPPFFDLDGALGTLTIINQDRRLSRELQRHISGPSIAYLPGQHIGQLTSSAIGQVTNLCLAQAQWVRRYPAVCYLPAIGVH